MNGAEVNETKNMGAGLIPNADSIAEFRLLTNSFSAEYGKFTGAVMNTVTKSGTNRFHGTLFEFYRNQGMDAKNYFDPTRIAVSLYDRSTQTFFTYDNPDTAFLKAKYIDLRVPGGLGGAFVWAVKDDDANGTMVKTLASGLGR